MGQQNIHLEITFERKGLRWNFFNSRDKLMVTLVDFYPDNEADTTLQTEAYVGLKQIINYKGELSPTFK